MKLHVHEWGSGDRLAVLVHGITSDSGSWVRVGPALAECGYRVLAPDLRGHGQSPRGEYGAQSWADDLVETLPASPEVAIGHSLGGLALALAVERLRPRRAVYEDPAWRVPAHTHGAAAAAFEGRKRWTREDLARENPRWSDPDLDRSLAAIAAWDPACASALLDGNGYDLIPTRPVVPSLLVLADPSALVPPELAEDLGRRGFSVVAVAGAGHSVHRDDLEGFLGALDGWV
jgi:pimeloyl-ACP methyl ester carboxylesterase